jgi:hypothetical protein
LPTLPNPQRNALWAVLFVLLVSSLALPFLLVKEPPLLDYPNHLARAFILNHLHDPAFHFSEYYRADWEPYPYILWDVLMLALQQGLPVEAAGKLLLIFNTVLLPFSVAWFLWQTNRTEIKLSFLACALCFSPLFLWGFEAFHLGMGLCFLMIGTWFWYLCKPSGPRAAFFFVLVFATYFAHLLAFASAALALSVFELTRFNWRNWLRLACFLAPASLLSLWAHPGLSGHPGLGWQPFMERLRLVSDYLIHGYNRDLDLFFAGGLVLCVLVAVVGNRELRVNSRWLGVALSFLVVFLSLPHQWGENYDVNVRLLPTLYFLIFAVFRIGRRTNWIVVLGVALTALRVFNVGTGFERQAQRNAAMDRGIEQIPRNARVFGIYEDARDVDLLDHYGHYWDYAVIRRGATTNDLFDISGQTPMRIIYDPYQDDTDNWEHISEYFDYIWCYEDTSDQGSISAIADKVYVDGPLTLYRVRKQQ